MKESEREQKRAKESKGEQKRAKESEGERRRAKESERERKRAKQSERERKRAKEEGEGKGKGEKKFWKKKIFLAKKNFWTSVFQKFMKKKREKLERSGLDHRVEKVPKFVPYKFHPRHKRGAPRAQLPHKKMENIISSG